MNNLVIGDSSQLSHYFPNTFHKISSRNIDFETIRKNNYDSVYVLFAEQRTFLNESENFFNEVNVDYTLKVIENIKDYVNSIKIYSTSELWNDYDGEVSLSDPYRYNYSPYIKSKEIISNIINGNKDKYNNVNIIYPFNFNSPFRKKGFLFSKIFDSLINKNKNVIGDINLKRDIIHPSVIVNESIKSNSDLIVGSGELIDIHNFVKDLFSISNMEFDEYISIDKNYTLPQKRNFYFSKNGFSNYDELLNLTIRDVKNNKIS
jgi:GDP-D-mannose dehydratase